MIKVHNSGYANFNTAEARYIPLDEVNIVTQNIHNGKPYILFEHNDYPGGALQAQFDGEYWDCDLD